MYESSDDWVMAWVFVLVVILLGAPWHYRHALAAVGAVSPAAFWLGKLL